MVSGHFGGKQKSLTFGNCPIVSLADARRKRNEAERFIYERTRRYAGTAAPASRDGRPAPGAGDRNLIPAQAAASKG